MQTKRTRLQKEKIDLAEITASAASEPSLF